MAIYKKTLDHWKLAKRREDLQLKDFEPNVTLGAFNEGGKYLTWFDFNSVNVE